MQGYSSSNGFLILFDPGKGTGKVSTCSLDVTFGLPRLANTPFFCPQEQEIQFSAWVAFAY